MSIYRKNIEQIDSFESTYRNVLFRNNNIIIPYVNLLVPSSLLNKEDGKMIFLSHSYMIFKNVTFLTVFIEELRRQYYVIDISKEKGILYFGGNYLDYLDKIFNDLQISCNEAYLETLPFTSQSNSPWKLTEIKDNYLYGQETISLKDFWEHKFLPPDIKSLME